MVNNCGSFHFTPAGSEFTLVDLGGNDGGWLAPWMLSNTTTVGVAATPQR